MSIEKLLNRLRYGFYTIESIETRAERWIGFTTHGLIYGTICNLLSIIGLKYMISLGAVPLCTIVVAAFFLDLYLLYLTDKKYLTDEHFEKYMPVFKKETFIRKILWAILAYALLVIVFAYFFVSFALFCMS
jgi:hypothetical protein